MDKFVGKRLDGRYEIKEIIGVGGMSVVYKAYDNIEDRIVAIKILKVGKNEKYSPYKNLAVSLSSPVICFTRLSPKAFPCSVSLVVTSLFPQRRSYPPQ